MSCQSCYTPCGPAYGPGYQVYRVNYYVPAYYSQCNPCQPNCNTCQPNCNHSCQPNYNPCQPNCNTCQPNCNHSCQPNYNPSLDRMVIPVNRIVIIHVKQTIIPLVRLIVRLLAVKLQILDKGVVKVLKNHNNKSDTKLF